MRVMLTDVILSQVRELSDRDQEEFLRLVDRIERGEMEGFEVEKLTIKELVRDKIHDERPPTEFLEYSEFKEKLYDVE